MSVAGVLSRPRRALALVAAAACAAAGIALTGGAAFADPNSTTLEKNMDATWSKLEANGEKYKENAYQLQKNQAQSRKLAKQLVPLQKKVDSMYKEVGSYAAAAYKGGNLSAVNSILTYGSASTMLDQVATLDRMAADQHRKVAKYEKAKNDLDAKKRRYDTLVAQNKKQQVKLAAEKKKLQGDMSTMEKQYQQTAAGRSQGGSGLPDLGYIPGPGGKAVRYAIDHLGDPYVWDTAGPNEFDCSGLTMAAWAAAGVSMRHYTYDQYSAFPHVGRNELMAGDLVFWNGAEHVGIYIGKGYVIHAPQPGEGVKVSPVDYPGTWYGAVRPG